MGEQWLSEVMTALAEAGWPVEAGYPGKKAMQLTQTAVCVNLNRVDTGSGSAGILVSVLVPRQLGLSHCQKAAADVAVLLTNLGGTWRFDGWSYDSGGDCFRVEVEGNAVLMAEETVIPAGYQIQIGEMTQPYVTAFTAKKDSQRRLIRPMGQVDPAGVTPGTGGWSITLDQFLPEGVAEPEENGDGFTLKAVRGGFTMVYTGCCWAEYESRQESGGVRVRRSGYALSRQEG